MSFKIVDGGFRVSAEDQVVLNTQKALTKILNQRVIQVGAIFLSPATKAPKDLDWTKRQVNETDLQSWIDSEDVQKMNAGFSLQNGWVDIDIDTSVSTPEYNEAIVAGLTYVGIDTRFRFGRISQKVPTHLFVHLDDEEAQNWDIFVEKAPKDITVGGVRMKVQLRSSSTNPSRINASPALQTVVPGSLYPSKITGDSSYDMSVWYGKDNKVASKITDIAETTPRRCHFADLILGIAFGTTAYLLKDLWVQGSRHEVAGKFTGLLARIVDQSIAINEHASLNSLCPIGSDEVAERLISFICDYFNDEEKPMRLRVYHDARRKLEQNPDAKIPGWPAFAAMAGEEAKFALQTVVTPGTDVSPLLKMSEMYIFDQTDAKYIDRERHRTHATWVMPKDVLEEKHRGDTIPVNNRPKELFKIFQASKLRKQVTYYNLYPDYEPGAIIRADRNGTIVPDDHERAVSTVFNSWTGWPVEPVAVPDADLMNDLVARLDRLLGYLTRDNPNQIEWIKKWLAWTFQYPGTKQQIAWVCVGGQGVGKSFFGNTFMESLMGGLWGAAAARSLEGAFSVESFIGKMFVFIDEATFSNESSTDEIKKLIRNVKVAGEQKFVGARAHNIYARIMFASNRNNVNAGQRNVTDRALFYTRAYDQDHLKMTEMEFRAWADTLKDWFSKFSDLLRDYNVAQHYMRYFLDLPTSKADIESIKHSSGNDAEIVMTNMSTERKVARNIVECGWVADQYAMFEAPFTLGQFATCVESTAKDFGLTYKVNTKNVLAEFGSLVEQIGANKFRFKYKYGDVVKMYSGATGADIIPCCELTDDDYGINELDRQEKNRRGKKPPF